MKQLPLDATDQEIINAIEEFVNFLAMERYSDAYHFLFHPTGESWYTMSPEKLENMIHAYISEHENITSVNTATGDFEGGISRTDGEIEGTAWYALPINKEWSEVMATFQILTVEDTLVFLLEDIHVP